MTKIILTALWTKAPALRLTAQSVSRNLKPKLGSLSNHNLHQDFESSKSWQPPFGTIFSQSAFMDKFHSPASEALQKIAAALGVHVECFFSNPPQSGSDTSADECLRLWSALRTEEGRRQALEDLRLIAKLERR